MRGCTGVGGVSTSGSSRDSSTSELATITEPVHETRPAAVAEGGGGAGKGKRVTTAESSRRSTVSGDA